MGCSAVPAAVPFAGLPACPRRGPHAQTQAAAALGSVLPAFVRAALACRGRRGSHVAGFGSATCASPPSSTVAAASAWAGLLAAAASASVHCVLEPGTLAIGLVASSALSFRCVRNLWPDGAHHRSTCPAGMAHTCCAPRGGSSRKRHHPACLPRRTSGTVASACLAGNDACRCRRRRESRRAAASRRGKVAHARPG